MSEGFPCRATPNENTQPSRSSEIELARGTALALAMC